MNVVVKLVDAFEDVEIELKNEKLVRWFENEAASKGKSLAELLSGKTAGLTVEQVRAVREKLGESELPRYVVRWIVNQQHTITTP